MNVFRLRAGGTKYHTNKNGFAVCGLGAIDTETGEQKAIVAENKLCRNCMRGKGADKPLVTLVSKKRWKELLG